MSNQATATAEAAAAATLRDNLPVALAADSICDILVEKLDEIPFQILQKNLDELECAGYIKVITTAEDEILYTAHDGINWSSVYMLDDPIKKSILLELIENPKSFFVYYNTQKGKLRIAGREMSKWASYQSKKIVNFLIVDNDRTLSSQSSEGISKCFPLKEEEFELNHRVRIFELSSNNKTSLADIKTYIDAYSYIDTYETPLIVILANNKQMEKFINLLYHIHMHPKKELSAGVIWDEADQTYPLYRNKKFPVRAGTELSFVDFIQLDDKTIYRTGFVTATDGELLEDDYPECANAHHYKQPYTDPNYRAIHIDNAIIKHIEAGARESNNIIAERLITTHWATHFSKPITLANGEVYFRKTIINSNPRVTDMHALAKSLVAKNAHCIVFSQYGLQLYKGAGAGPIKIATRKKYFNKVLFATYKKYGLNDRPLFILGRKKVDRGLGFHYAPRPGNRPERVIYDVETDGVEGLIWTDLILGNKIENLAKAVQKAGRGAGIIAQCPQYCGNFTYWGVEQTLNKVIDHNRVVDAANLQLGENTILQAKTRAEATVPRRPRKIHDVDPALFRVIKADSPRRTLEITKEIITTIFGDSFRAPQRDGDGFYKTSLNTSSVKVDHITAVKKVPTAYGTHRVEGQQESAKTYRRFLPCYSNLTDINSLHCVIPLIDPSYTVEQKEQLDQLYEEFIYEIPQEEDASP